MNLQLYGRKDEIEKKFCLLYFHIKLVFWVTPIVYADDLTGVDDPAVAFQSYLDALQTGDKDKILPYLNEESLVVVRNGSSYSQDRMAKEAAALSACGDPASMISGKRAVVYFSSDKKTCNPYFMEYQKDFWRVDLLNMSKAIRFNDKNEWKIDRDAIHPYTFAFSKKK